MAASSPPQPPSRREAGAKAKEPRVTPVMKQFAEAKSAYPDAIIFFRLGDFYEMFHEDAVIASKILGITLTSRNRENPDDEPMAGVPHHSAHGYVAKLLAAGHKVAICEQMADPAKTKGIVPRAVVRVITPGLVTHDGQLEARENHFLGAVEADEGSFGVALLDLSTGELFAARAADPTRLVAELAGASPRELLLAPEAHDLTPTLRHVLPLATLRSEAVASRPADETIAELLGAELAKDASRSQDPIARRAIARVLAFAAACNPRERLPITRVARLESDQAMLVDETAQAHLELVRATDGGKKGTLLDTIDRTVTPFGARLLRQRLLAPLVAVRAIRARQAEVELFVLHARSRAELRAALGDASDLERLAVRVALGEATPRDLGALRDGLAAAPRARAAVESLPASERSALGWDKTDVVPELAELLSRALVERPPPTDKDGGFVRDGYDPELDRARELQKNGTELVVALEAELRQATGAASLRVKYTRVFGWYIEVTKSHLGKVPTAWRRKQTVAGGERYTNDRLDQLAADIESAEGRALELERAVFEELTSRARAAGERVRALARRLAEWDVAAALAELAHQNDYVKPDVDDEDIIDIVDGRHPVVEQYAAKDRFVPNDTCLDLGAGRLWLVTGPNMAGKSTLMRQVALIVLLAQMGSYVPARRARVGVVDRLLSRVGASDNVSRGESTFMVEMRETAAILLRATRRSLVILDEIGRGTSTYDGLAIAWAVAEHLHDVIGCRALFATHYHELTELAGTSAHLVNVSVSAREHDGGVVFLHTLAKGPASRSYGIAVARLAGLPEGVLARAKGLLATFEAGSRPDREPGAPPKMKGKAGQLGLFEAPSKESTAERAVVATIREADIDRMTPLEALQLVAKLRARLAET